MTTQEFNALSQSDKAILVAKDMLFQIEVGLVVIQTGSYCELDIYEDNGWYEDVQANMDKITFCKVCALGAAMLSITKFANKLTFNQLDNFHGNEVALELLSNVFNPHQLLLIETAFEGHDPNCSRIGISEYNDSLNYEEIKECETFYGTYEDDEERLIAICNNIIDNQGVFKPNLIKSL